MSNSINSGYANRAELQDQYSAQKAEKDELQKQSETEIENMKRSYSAEKADLADRFEKSTQAERLAHYDHLRSQKAQMEREERRLEQTGKQYVESKRDTLRHEAIKAEEDGRGEVTKIEKQYAQTEEQLRNSALNAEAEIRTNHRKNAELIISDSNKKVQDLQAHKMQELENHKLLHGQALNEMQSHYDQLRTGVQSQYDQELHGLKVDAANDLNTRRVSNAAWVKEYSDRASDPFYRMTRYPSSFEDMGDAYQIKVKVPQYERDHFKVQVSGLEVQLSGVRTNSEKAEVEPGRWISTNSHQSVTERIQLDQPVDSRAMTMKSNGDWVEYTLPKIGPNHRGRGNELPSQADRDELAMIQELKFNDSLPKPTSPPGPRVRGSNKGPLTS